MRNDSAPFQTKRHAQAPRAASRDLLADAIECAESSGSPRRGRIAHRVRAQWPGVPQTGVTRRGRFRV